VILSQLATKSVGSEVSLTAEAVWQPSQLATKSVGSEFIWLPSQLEAKSIGCQVSWKRSQLAAKSVGYQVDEICSLVKQMPPPESSCLNLYPKRVTASI
jgi:hypothetical protein